MIRIEVRGTEAVIAKLRGFSARLQTELSRAINQEAFALQSYIQSAKLSGQVLQVKTGALRSSIYYRMEESKEQVVGIVYAPLSQVPYAGIQEYGGTINHPGGTAYFISGRSGGEYVAGGPTFVANRSGIAYALPRTRPHVIKIPERSFMRSSLDDRKSNIVNALQDAVVRAIKGV